MINNEAPTVFVHYRGLFFCMPSSFAGGRQLELLNSIYFSIINIKSGRLFACRRLVEGFRLRATEELFDYKMSYVSVGAGFYSALTIDNSIVFLVSIVI